MRHFLIVHILPELSEDLLYLLEYAPFCVESYLSEVAIAFVFQGKEPREHRVEHDNILEGM